MIGIRPSTATVLEIVFSCFGGWLNLQTCFTENKHSFRIGAVRSTLSSRPYPSLLTAIHWNLRSIFLNILYTIFLFSIFNSCFLLPCSHLSILNFPLFLSFRLTKTIQNTIKSHINPNFSTSTRFEEKQWSWNPYVNAENFFPGFTVIQILLKFSLFYSFSTLLYSSALVFLLRWSWIYAFFQYTKILSS